MLFTAYSIVRTVPSANRPNRRKKKNVTVVRLCGCLCFVWVVVLFVCLGVFLVCFLFVVCFLFFVFRFLHSKCDKGSGLCIGPLPVYFCGHYSFGPCTSQLINLICNMLGNMLNDLAEAIRRWTEKINSVSPKFKVQIGSSQTSFL